MNRRQFTLGALSAVGTTMLATPRTASAQQVLVVDPPVRSGTSRIEVAIVFALGWKQSFELERGELAKWVVPADVELTHEHAAWSWEMKAQQNLYSTLRALGCVDVMLPKAFDHVHVRDLGGFTSPKEIAGFFAASGIDPERAMAVYHSYGVQSMMRQTDLRLEWARVDGAPRAIVDGRFMVRPDVTGNASLLSTVDLLVQRIRSERAAGAAK